MNIDEINPYIRAAAPCILKKTNNVNIRIILDYELAYLEEGILQLTYNNSVFRFTSGDIFLVCPGIPHSFSCISEQISIPHMHFDLAYDHLSSTRYICFKGLDALSQDEQRLIQENAFPSLSDKPLLFIKDKKYFLEVFFSIINLRASQDLSRKARMLELLNIIIADNKLHSFEVNDTSPNIASQIKEYIDANYEFNFQLCDLERQFCYSKFYIDKLFKKEFGASVMQYRCQLRLKKAAILLQEYSVTKVAQMLGFSSVQTFSRAFRSFYHVSPTKYIQNALHSSDELV